MESGKPQLGAVNGHFRMAAFALALSLSACGGGQADPVMVLPPPPSPIPESPTLLEQRVILPSQTRQGLDDRYGEHLVYWPANLTEPDGAVVFLAGSGAEPRFYRDLMRLAAREGQVVIGLAYVNDQAVNALCPPDVETLAGNCHGDLRAEIVYGEPRSALVEVSPAESVQGRLTALLGFLQAQAPAVAWERLLDGTPRPRWSMLTVAGHSQGGGHAAFIGQREAVHRAVLFSATEPARWTAATEATPRSAFFGFAHLREIGFGGIIASWDRLQLPGELVEVDGLLPDVPQSQRLFTSAAACDSNESSRHGCTSVDVFLPRQGNGDLLFATVFAAWLAPRQP
jgi:hypothetical protein